MRTAAKFGGYPVPADSADDLSLYWHHASEFAESAVQWAKEEYPKRHALDGPKH